MIYVKITNIALSADARGRVSHSETGCEISIPYEAFGIFVLNCNSI